MTTDVLIDVDGVINALSHHPEKKWGWTPSSIRRKWIMGYPIRWSSDFLESLTRLHEQEDVEIFWLTTWLDEAVNELSHHAEFEAGKVWTVLGHEPYQRENPFSRGKPGLPQNVNDWWKLDAAQEHFVARQNRFVWIDDDLKDNGPARDWASSLQAGSNLLVAPDPLTGVDRALFESIVEWIDQS